MRKEYQNKMEFDNCNNFSIGGISTDDCKSFEGNFFTQRNNFLCDSKEYDPRNYANHCKIASVFFSPSGDTNELPKVESIINRQNNCSICDEDLPRYLDGNCIRCGYKPLPFPKCPIYDENITAEDIIREWESEMQKVNSCQRKHSTLSNRCKCTKDSIKPCAHCRIKENCRQLIENISKNLDKTVSERIRQTNFENNDNSCNVNLKGNKTLKKNETTSSICKEIMRKQGKPTLNSSTALEELRKIYGSSDKNQKLKHGFSKTKDLRKSLSKKDTITTIYKNKFKDSKVQNMQKEKVQTEKPKKNIKRLKKKLCKRKRQFRTFRIPKNLPRINFSRHSNCLTNVRVPHNMGWLWTVFTKENSKFRPGYIPKPIKELMIHFIKPIDVLPVGCRARKQPENPVSEEILKKSILNVKRINGKFIITLYPSRDAKSCESDDPNLETKPIRFVINKRKHTDKQNEFKKILKEKGFKKCTCHKPILKCECRPQSEKQCLEKEIANLCKESQIPNIQSKMYFTDTTDTTDTENDVDIHFIPPVGSFKRKPDAVVKETQYDPADFQKPEPYQSPFKITHPNYKPPLSMRKNIGSKDTKKGNLEVGRKKSIGGGKQGKKAIANNGSAGGDNGGGVGGRKKKSTKRNKSKSK